MAARVSRCVALAYFCMQICESSPILSMPAELYSDVNKGCAPLFSVHVWRINCSKAAPDCKRVRGESTSASVFIFATGAEQDDRGRASSANT